MSDAVDPLALLRTHQAGRCAVCREKRSSLLVDHDHETGMVRGLMCCGCNSREGKDAYAPWFQAYRENPPAKQIGIEVRYGEHKPRVIRRVTADDERQRPSMNTSDWLDMMMASAELTGGVAIAPGEPSELEAKDAFRRQCSALGYAPKPVNVTAAEWRMALAEAFDVSKMFFSGPFWCAAASRAFVQIGRTRSDGDDYLSRWAEC